MTYNFDPDKWYENESYILNLKLVKEEITQNQYDELLEVLDKKLDEMWNRLDGTYQLNFDKKLPKLYNKTVPKKIM